jgi:hypothetical protein
VHPEKRTQEFVSVKIKDYKAIQPRSDTRRWQFATTQTHPQIQTNATAPSQHFYFHREKTAPPHHGDKNRGRTGRIGDRQPEQVDPRPHALVLARRAAVSSVAVYYNDAAPGRKAGPSPTTTRWRAGRPEHIDEHVDPRHAPLCSLDMYACWSSPCCSSLWRGEIDVDGEVLVAAIRQDVVSISILTDVAPSDPTRLRLQLVTSLRLHWSTAPKSGSSTPLLHHRDPHRPADC